MSKDKHRSRERRLEFLRLANSRPDGRLYLNCHGGLPYDNPDIQRLIKEGLFKLDRTPSFPGIIYGCGTPNRKTYVEITEEGKKVLEK